jgi:hypothetical protein
MLLERNVTKSKERERERHDFILEAQRRADIIDTTVLARSKLIVYPQGARKAPQKQDAGL